MEAATVAGGAGDEDGAPEPDEAAGLFESGFGVFGGDVLARRVDAVACAGFPVEARH